MVDISKIDIRSVKDDCSLVSDICNEFEQRTGEFIQKRGNRKYAFDSAIKAIDKDYEAERDRKANKYNAHLDIINDQEKHDIDRFEADFKADSDQMSERKQEVRDEYARKCKAIEVKAIDVRDEYARKCKAIEESDKSEEFRQKEELRLDGIKQGLSSLMRSIQTAEDSISCRKPYEKIFRGSKQAPVPAANSLDKFLELFDPYERADKIDRSCSFFNRLFRPGLRKKRCVEFASYRKKASKIYEAEIRKLPGMKADAMRRYQEMKDEIQRQKDDAESELLASLSKIDDEFAPKKQAYIDGHLKIEQDFNDRRESKRKKHESDMMQLEEKRKNDIADAKREYVQDQLDLQTEYKNGLLASVPPEALKGYVDYMNGRKAPISSFKDYQVPREEPLNVTVGDVSFDFREYFSSKSEGDSSFIKRFFEDNYGFVTDGDRDELRFPYSVAMDEKFAFCYRFGAYDDDNAIAVMRKLCLSIFLANPPGRVKFNFIDCLRNGYTFESLYNLKGRSGNQNNALSEFVFGEGTRTSAEKTTVLLRDIVEYIKRMGEEALRGDRFANIRSYNDANKLTPQPYNIIGIMDFPNGFASESIGLLERILKQGGRCGVYVILMINESQLAAMDSTFLMQIANIERECACFGLNGIAWSKRSEGKFDAKAKYVFDRPVSDDDIEAIGERLGNKEDKEISEIIRPNIDYFDVVMGHDKNKYLNCSIGKEGIKIPIGILSDGHCYNFELGAEKSQSHHALVCGNSGAGKSRLLHAIIMGALMEYTKEELQIYLVDFKEGTEFKIYADYNLPNFNVIAIESEQEFGISVLKGIYEEFDKRGRLFRGEGVVDINAYNSKLAESGYVDHRKKMPRLLIIIDEFQHLFDGGENSVICSEAKRILSYIIREGRALGIHLILSSQTVKGINWIDEGTKSQIAVRIALKCSDENASEVLGKAAEAIKQIGGDDVGTAIYVPSISDSEEKNFKIRIGNVETEKQKAVLKELDEYYTSKGIVNHDAHVLVSDVKDSRNSVFQRYYAKNEVPMELGKLHFGEPLNIDRKMEVGFNRAAGDNMLLLGNDSQKAQDMLTFIVLDLVLQRISQLRNGKQPARINVINCCDGSPVLNRDKDCLMRVGVDLDGCFISYCSGEKAAQSVNDLYERCFQKSDEEYEAWEERRKSSPDEWLVVSGLDLADDLMSRNRDGSPGVRLEKIIEEGPEHGVFTIIWCRELKLFEECFYKLHVKFKEYFHKRVLFGDWTEKDAVEYAKVTKYDDAGKNNAYIFQKGSVAEKFRSYSTPMEDWLEEMLSKLNKEDATGFKGA